MSNQTVTDEKTLVGGWTPYGPVTAEDRAIFDEALNGFVGVHYTPESVSTQVVSGTNYRFKCNASVPPSEVVWEAIVEIHQPLPGQGKPHIISITRI
ncbi:hypothetical protein [uncultured Tenacibaculum sp.]|uniref:hypothetical protein n=1 Tax=uncultured Tenacibaculum sp. TaxID=174713 RepID=UPI00260FD7C3|nr:hypothetical protein [uncultured Tenacibaculum sp.]